MLTSSKIQSAESLHKESGGEKWWVIGEKEFTTNKKKELAQILWDADQVKSTETSLEITSNRSTLVNLSAKYGVDQITTEVEKQLDDAKNTMWKIDPLVRSELIWAMLANPENHFDDVQDAHGQESLHTHPTPDLRCSPTDVSTWKRLYEESKWKTKYHYIAWFDDEWAMYMVKYHYSGKPVHHYTWGQKVMISKSKWWVLLDWTRDVSLDQIGNVQYMVAQNSIHQSKKQER